MLMQLEVCLCRNQLYYQKFFLTINVEPLSAVAALSARRALQGAKKPSTNEVASNGRHAKRPAAEYEEKNSAETSEKKVKLQDGKAKPSRFGSEHIKETPMRLARRKAKAVVDNNKAPAVIDSVTTQSATLAADDLATTALPESQTFSRKVSPDAYSSSDGLPSYAQDDEDDSSRNLEQDVDTQSAPSSAAHYGNRALSSVPLDTTRIAYGSGTGIGIRMLPGETLIAIGEYDIWVKSGLFEIMGAKLSPSVSLRRVYAPASHSLPSISCIASPGSSIPYAELELISCTSGLRLLKRSSPNFTRLWNNMHTRTETASKKLQFSKRSFSILRSSFDDPEGRPLTRLIINDAWKAKLTELAAVRRGRPPTIMVCGPKSSGKSTFSRQLLNHTLSEAEGRARIDSLTPKPGVALLDLDPGQPEFSPPGEVYLAHLKNPVFGPPFTHPTLFSSSEGRIVRSHHIGANSPKDDPHHYIRCAADLFHHYQELSQFQPPCPLIINCPGWVIGTGLEILLDLIRELNVSDIVYMSEFGPSEVVDALVTMADQSHATFSTLSSQPVEYMTRTSASLREMQTMSYFHLAEADDRKRNVAWGGAPLEEGTSWEVEYDGSHPGILGVVTLGERINPRYLPELINGSVVSVTIIEDERALVAFQNNDLQPDDDMEVDDPEQTSNLDGEPSSPAEKDEPKQSSCEIVKAAPHYLPYLLPNAAAGTSSAPLPAYSYTIGQALVQSISFSRRSLRLLCPIPPSIISSHMSGGKKVVLVRGKLDAPSWAYREAFHASGEATRKDTAEKEDDTFFGASGGDRPWLSVLEGGEGRGTGRVWRIRKDLGRKIGND